ncbi:MAG: IPT/TIG domain-containing protein, partial [Terracidiphilus sp.]
MHERTERHKASTLTLILAFLVAATSLLSGCSSSFTINDPGYFTAISAVSGTIRVNQQIQIVNNAKKTGVPLIFSVNGIVGGDGELGTVDGNGVYTAPAIVPIPNTVTITSVASKFPSYPPGSVTLGVLNPIPVLGSVTPSGFSEGTTTVTVDGSQFVYGAQIIWKGVAVPTTFVSGTQLVASIGAPNPGTFPLLVSNPNPGSANSATANVVVGPGQVVLTLEPANGMDVRVSNKLNIGLTVMGTNNTGVSLQVNGIPGGNAQFGTAVSNADGSITYTAPP